jgi:hypothetical protein
MLVLLPFSILIFAAAVLYGLQAFKFKIRSTWLICLGVSIAVWVFLLVVPMNSYEPIHIGSWLPYSQILSRLTIQMDDAGLFAIVCLMTTLIAVIISAVGRLQLTKPNSWIAYLFISSLGILAILAYDPISLVLAWGILDIFELIIILNLQRNSKNRRPEIINFGFRTISTFLILWAFVAGTQRGNVVNIITETNPAVILVLIAAVLRLGILPINLSESIDAQNNRGLGTLTRIVAPASGFVLLTRIPLLNLPSLQISAVKIVILLLMLYSASRWLVAKDEIQGRKYWIAAWSGFLVVCALNGSQASLLGWGSVVLMLSATIFLYSYRANHLVWIPVISIFCMMGFPFTITQLAWSGVFGKFDVFGVSLFIIHSVLIIGGLYHVFQKSEKLDSMEKALQVFYGMGLVFPVIGSYFLLLKMHISFAITEYWWLGLISAGLVILGFISIKLLKSKILQLTVNNVRIEKYIRWFLNFFTFQWFSQAFSWFHCLIGMILGFLSGVLEGEGGILWAVLLLALLISLLRSGGG